MEDSYALLLAAVAAVVGFAMGGDALASFGRAGAYLVPMALFLLFVTVAEAVDRARFS